MVGNHLGYLPIQNFIVKRALAQAEIKTPEPPKPAEDNQNKLGIIAILVEEDLLDDFAMRSRVMTYANSAQQRIPHSKSFVMEVDKNESTFRIASVLEKLYFEGIDEDLIDGNPFNNDKIVEDDNQLIGVIVIGDVPIPVVHEENGLAAPSLYPYTDFYRKAYIFDHESDQFVANESVTSKNPEVWHGLIVPPSKDEKIARQELLDYFDKNYEYTTGSVEFADFEKRLLYANYPEMEKQMNYMDYKNYERYIKYMEEFSMYRFNKHLLKEFIKEVSSDLGSETPVMDDASIDSMYDVHTENIFKKYAYNFAQALRIYRSGINEAIQNTGRWEPGEVDSPESLIAMRDEYGKYQIKRKQLELEKETNDYIKNQLSTAARQEQITTTAKLNIKLRILDIEIDSNTFNFQGYFDGQKANEITSSSQCGMQVGQQRQENQSVLENNSVLVKANRMYNPATQLSNPNRDEDWEIEEDLTYKLYGGCVFDNSIYVEQTGANPNKCVPEFAMAPLFDIVGAKEVPPEETTNLAGRCDASRMTFKLENLLQYLSTAVEGLVVPLDFSQSLKEVIDQAYVMLLGNDPNADSIIKGSYVMQKLAASGQKLIYSPQEGVEVELNVTTQKKPIDTLYSHVEPTNETIKAIKHIGADPVEFSTTPSTPADGIRYISLAKNGIKQVFEYLNLFRIEGNNFEEIHKNLETQYSDKQKELNQITENQSNLLEDFISENSEVLEPLEWRAASIDQKLEQVIPKYVDRDSGMPTPFYNPRKSPQMQPIGYEVMHIVADGDTQGYQFGLNRAMLAKAPKGTGGEKDSGDLGTGTSGPDLEGDGEGGAGETPDDGEFLCGDPAGVEIWEWFEALQCWINEEILPAAELFKLNNSCSAAPLPIEEDEPIEDLFDEILPSAKAIDVKMKRKSLVKNDEVEQKEKIMIYVLDAEREAGGKEVLGYIDKPISIEMTDDDVGTLSNEDNIHIFKGSTGVEFTPEETGHTTLTVGMQDIAETRTFDVDVFESIGIKWAPPVEEVKAGRSEFTISMQLKNPEGKDITNINDTIQLAPEQPADGGFENNGVLQLTNGYGQIKFIPTPGKKSVKLMSKDPYITGELTIYPTPVPATQILLRSEPYLEIGERAEIQVIAADSFGFPSEAFNKPIKVRLSEESQKYASLVSDTINISKGVGTIMIKGGRETADITLIAEHEDLKDTKLELPLLARVDSEEWKETYPQNLFASLVGFPAGDFTQEDYFGGTHLFSGKTEAVYSFLSAPTPEMTLNITPNHLITTTKPSQTVLVGFSNNEILLQAFDMESMQTLISKKAPLNLSAIEEYEGQVPEVGKLYVDVLSSDYAAIKSGEGYQIKSLTGQVVADLQPKLIQINSSFKWEYETEPEFNAVELKLTDGLGVTARIMIGLAPEKLLPENFEEINPNLKWDTVYGGKSVNDPTGLVFYAYDAEVPEVKRNEFYGIEGTDKYLSLFASGTNVGDAVKYKMPPNAVLLGDPTIRLKTKSTSSLNYNSATGQQIYEDPEGKQIASINHFNFNNDGFQDIAVLTEDGRVRLLEGGPTEPPYKNKGNMAFLVDGGVALENFDFDKDNYEDLVIATEEGRLAILHNNEEVITRTDQTINVGKKIYQILKGDMDQDGFGDLVILDSRGDIYIFYYNGSKGRFPENGKWIGNYGLSLKLGQNLNTDIDIRYDGIPEPSQPGTAPGQQVVPSGSKPPLEGYEIGGSVDPGAALAFFKQGYEANKTAGKDPAAATQKSDPVPKLPWPEGDDTETYFAPIETTGGINVTKTISNKDRPGEKNVDLEETLTFTIEINPGKNMNGVVLADTVPDSLAFQMDSVTCVEGGCDTLQAKQNGIKTFFSGINLKVGQKTTITYDVFMAHTPEAQILIGQINEPNENLPIPDSIIDQYIDIFVSPPYNNTGRFLLHYTTGPRNYELVQDNAPKPKPSGEGLSTFSALMEEMAKFDGQEFGKDNPPPKFDPGAILGDAAGKMAGNDECLDSADNMTSCIEGGLDDFGDTIADFSCIGGGCFPMPFNRAFLVPPEFPLPIFSFPTTLPTPVGPIPVPSVFGAPSVLGMASIPGPIMSQIRIYLSPTLTGGIGTAMCWGPYPQTPTVPPPVFPIPYPPPIGNCMVTALPVEDMFGGLCSSIRDDVIGPIMDAIRAGVNKVNSTVNDINNNEDYPINVDQTGPDDGAGGLEISLAVNLGNSMKFDPPVKANSNTHIPAFDSLGSVISGWWDRQVLEIQNKLLTLPTFSIYLPDIKSVFTLDWEKTEKRFEGWKNVMSGSRAATGESLDKIEEGGIDTNEILDYTNAIGTQASIYNLNTLEGLYDVASTLPLVKLTEQPIELAIPWLSSAEIQAWIIQAQQWVIYYEREYDRVKDKWEALTCDNQQADPSDPNAGERGTVECGARQLADMFGANFDPLINSVKENIEVLQSYLDFPKKLVKFKQQLADYIRSVACYLNEIAMFMGGWLATIQQQMITWAEVIYTIIEIIKNIEALFDLFVDFDTSCDICTNERYANFGWWMLLGLVLPEIPIIQFPKIPDIVLDMSNFDAQVDIELPILKLRTKPIPLPPLPYIRLPDLPNINMFLSLPPLPILPRLPDLPDLPALPPLPTIDLPTLPAPPKLPDVAQAFEAVIPIIEKILEIWCIMKKSFAPVPEQMLNDQITLLTNRPAYLIPLDLMKIQLPNIALFDLGFNELRIETIIYLGLRIKTVIRPLEEFASDLNNGKEGWEEKYDAGELVWPGTNNIPKIMNKWYAAYLKETEGRAQEALDSAEDQMQEWADEASAATAGWVQDWIDENLGEKLSEYDQLLRDKEAAWQQAVDDFGDEHFNPSYEEYYEAIQRANESVENWSNEAAEDVQKWFAENSEMIDAINNIIPGVKIIEYVSDGNFDEDFQEVTQFVADKLNDTLTLGPWVLPSLQACLIVWPYCKDHQEDFFGEPKNDEEASAVLAPELPAENKKVAQVPAITPEISEEEYVEEMLKTPQGQEMKALFAQLADELNKVNEREPVDYTVLKEQFGIPDYVPSPHKTTVDKLKLMEKELLKHSDQLVEEAENLKKTNDLTAIAGVRPLAQSDYKLADTKLESKPGEVKSYTNALPAKEPEKGENLVEKAFRKLTEKTDRTQAQGSGEESSGESGGGSCGAAVCLPDPITQQPVPVIPNIELIGNSETLFMPSGNLVYSDGTGLYLKRDLTLDDSDMNSVSGTPKRFSFDKIADALWIDKAPKEAVNMLQSTFTENGASTFTWAPMSHPDFYGYGIELERTVTGYDADKQDNELADTKIILLPPNEDGKESEVTVNGEQITFGTLVTSLGDREEAAKRFGVNPSSIVTDAEDVRFPTVGNALIKVNENKAVLFDRLDGSAYNMNMENGYYQIKMTWFDENADTANYNQNEIIAPQIYAGTAEPIDISQKEVYYMPIFKEKEIKASEIFVDLAGAYNYYWFVNPDTNLLTPITGDTLVIPAQNEVKSFKVKLVATQNLTDDSFERFEKILTVNVYVPNIDLNPDNISEGIISGDMTPIAKAEGGNLSEMPFSVFRKRLGTWKNIGILRDENPNKTPTNPALGENQSYYSIDPVGSYYIEGFEILDPSPIELKDSNGDVVAEVQPGTGLIDLFDPAYTLKAVSGSTTTPTHIAIIDKESEMILGNVYYIAAVDDNITIENSSLNQNNVADTGSTVGDANSGDDIVAATIPAVGPTFPGGVAIFEEGSQENVALVDKDGTIRMMKANYDLKIKNPGSTNDPYIFQIINSGGSAIFDVFIQADFENLQVDSETKMNSLNMQIGLLDSDERAYAQASPVEAVEIESEPNATPVPEFQFEPEEPRQLDGNPFPDVNETHPYFNQILELYKSRVVSGYADGSFKPDQKLTRAEFIKIALGVTNCMDCTTPNQAIKEKYLGNPFPDVRLPSWFFYCISIAKELGMITGYGDGLFRPDRNISRAEAAAVLLRQAGIELEEAPEGAFVDVPDYAWYVDYVYTAVQIGLIQENFGIVAPDEEITRGEFAFMAAGVKDLKECREVDTDGDGVPDWWEMTHGMDMFTPDAERACPCYDNPWPADTDGDGIRDICDLDIDNDGVLNPMCILTDTGAVDPDKLKAGLALLGEVGDNCIFTQNADQADLDGDGIGNLCDEEAYCECTDNPNLNDTDQDGIRDVCDDDIDNDGILNPICILFDENGLFDRSKLIPEGAKEGEGEEYDNCIFIVNPDQQDGDENTYGDVCEVTDLCPPVPEDLDGVDDEDGCPELNDEFPEKDPGIYVSPGELCALLDYTSDFVEGDSFMTAITDLETHETIFSKSPEVLYTP